MPSGIDGCGVRVPAWRPGSGCVRRPRGSGRHARWARRIASVACLLLALVAGPCEARRLALVIGNDNYKHVQPLKNARQDAKSIAGALQALGFDVTLKQDLTLSGMKAALRDFKGRIAGGDEAIFYFSGHGVQFEGTNYLVPIDIVAESEQQVADDAVPLQRVLDDLRDQKARFTLAIVDACRDNPFKGQGRAIGGRGLAPVTAANGQMVLYSAGAGQAALDRLGPNDADPNGVFTRVLIKQLNRAGVPADRILKNVRDEVVELANSVHHDQVPALYDQSIGEFYFRPGPAAAPQPSGGEVASVPAAPAAAPAVHLPTAGELELSYWLRIKDSTDPQDFKEYERQFPKGAHAAEAALMARKLSRQTTHAPEPTAAAGSAPSVPESSSVSGASPAMTGQVPIRTSGPYPAYITSSLQPGQTLQGAILINSDGSFFYQGNNGIQLRGTLNLSNPFNITGTGMAMMPKALGVIQMTYPDGSATTAVTMRGQLVNGIMQGQFATKFETGTFVFNLGW